MLCPVIEINRRPILTYCSKIYHLNMKKTFDIGFTSLRIPSYLQEDHLVLRLGVGLQLVAPPPQLAELVLQASGQLLRVALGVALPCGDHLHQLRLTLLHHALQLGVHLPALLQLLLSARLQEERVQTERRLRANLCCYFIYVFHHDFCQQAGCFPDKLSHNQKRKITFFCPW